MDEDILSVTCLVLIILNSYTIICTDWCKMFLIKHSLYPIYVILTEDNFHSCRLVILLVTSWKHKQYIVGEQLFSA